MSHRSRALFRPICDALEARETPAVLFTDSFEATLPPALSPGWSQWTNVTGGFATTRETQATGTTALVSSGSVETQSRLWRTDAQPADTGAFVRFRSDGPVSAQVFARGRDLDSALPSYLAAVVAPGGRQVDLIEVINGQSRTVATVTGKNGIYGAWLGITLQPVGGSATIRVQRPDTNQFLNSAGLWQTAPVDAITAPVNWKPSTGQVGVARGTGVAGIEFYDDFSLLSIPAVPTVPPAVPPAPLPPPTVPPAPPAATPIRESFDATALGNRPAGWAGWTSDGSAGFVASPTRAVAVNGFAATGNSPTTARAWLTATQPADVQASASLYADSLIPGLVIVRGANLTTATPTYYALAATRGLDVKLVRVVDGLETTIASLRSTSYVSGAWIRLTLTANGDQLRAVVFRTDTGRWLTATGDWSDVPQTAMQITDTGIRTGGLVGLVRKASSAGTIAFDDVEVRSAAGIVGPTINVTASQSGTSFTGDVTFRATADGPAPKRIEFAIDGAVQSAAVALPATWTLDTTRLANGPHTLTVRAVDAAGNDSTTTVRFTTTNSTTTPDPTRPTLANHYDHIRIAQLAYSGNPMGAFEKARLADSVDLVIPNQAYLGAIDAAAPTTPQIIYGNVSNLYLDLLSDWLSYADRTGVNRELAFYHVTAATPFTGSSPSSVPVNYLWNVSRGVAAGGAVTDLTAAARGGRTFGVVLAGVDSVINFSHLEKFRELNVTVNRPAAAGWQGVWEYATAVAADGTPTGWKTLRLIADGTNGFSRDGQLTFDPPTDWVASKLPGVDRLYTVRIRTTAGTALQAPELKTIFGRDYVGAAGQTKGTIPAFDYAADKDGDGYLTDAEYANRAPGKDARFIYESRLFYPYYGQMRFVTNPASTGVQRWAADYYSRQLAANPLADGLFLDNASGRIPFTGTSVIEPTTGFSAASAGVVAAVRRANPTKLVFTNTSGGLADANAVAAASTGVIEEFLLRPTDASWATVNDVASLVQARLTTNGPYVVLDSHPGTFATTDSRVQIGTLAYYYLMADPEQTMLMFFGGYAPAAGWNTTWIPAATVNVGKPTAPMTTFATGTDPQNTALTYKVFRRDYGNAIVLYKPRSYTQAVGTGTTADATATTHDLGGTYRVLNADGTLGATVTQVTLRNGEGAVLMKV